jgi:aromatic ring-opening dioxygenase catalytic subunit (LigB family)
MPACRRRRLKIEEIRNRVKTVMQERQPSFFIPHGGGPCFFMDDPIGAWTKLKHFLQGLPALLPRKPDALIVISGHWEAGDFSFTGSRHPTLIYDYYGFPLHTYSLTYPAPGRPELAEEGARLFAAAGLSASVDSRRGYDHGIFIPLKVAFPDADIPIVGLSLQQGLDPRLHVAAGRALRPLRDCNVTIIGSGMSFHNLPGFRDPRLAEPSALFDAWLAATITAEEGEREDRLTDWARAPGARECHPREEHLLPLMVAAGTSDRPGQRVFAGAVVDKRISAFRFD